MLIAAVAIALRLYAIDRLPPGLFGDESVEGLDALDVLAGNLGIWFHAHLGREPIYVYLVALSYKFFGVTPLATRLPAIVAGLLTIPATFFFVREWATQILPRERVTRVALLTIALIAISFWHIQMTRDAHRDTLLPLVEVIGYYFLWRAFRTCDWKMYVVAGAVLGLAIYTYSPGRFVGVFVAVFVLVEVLVYYLTAIRRPPTANISPSAISGQRSILLLGMAGIAAIIVMLPLGIYFAQNPGQFSRRFESVSVLDQAAPVEAFTSSVTGNLAQFVVPDAGYRSKHYNLPGKPVFDLLIAPWFLAGGVIALTRLRQSQYRFLLLWFAVMMVPAFLTADMIPKGVRVLGVVPGVFIFPALAMDWLCSRWQMADGEWQIADGKWRDTVHATRNTQPVVSALVGLSIVGSAIWTTYDYFIAWANMPELPLAFDADQVEVADYINRQPTDQSIYLSQEVYRPPTQMLLAERVPTSQYVDRATRFKEMDARTTLIVGANPIYVFTRDHGPSEEWLARVAPQANQIEQGKYFVAYRLGTFAPPQRAVDASLNSYLRIKGFSRYEGEDGGVVIYYQIVGVPSDRQDANVTVTLRDANGKIVGQSKHRFGAPPLEWNIGDTIVEWYPMDVSELATSVSIEFSRNKSDSQTLVLLVK